MRAVLTRAGIVCILIAGCGGSGAGVETGTGGEIGGSMGGSAGNGTPTAAPAEPPADVRRGGTPTGAGGTAGIATTAQRRQR